MCNAHGKLDYVVKMFGIVLSLYNIIVYVENCYCHAAAVAGWIKLTRDQIELLQLFSL